MKATHNKATHERGRRRGLRSAGGIVEADLIRPKRRRLLPHHYGPFLPGAGPTVPPVRVLNPDGSLREVVSAQEWRRRHGNPFSNQEEA